MTSKATSPSALFKIENWRAARIMVLMSPPALAVSLHMFIKDPRNRNPHPTVSYASLWRLCTALYCAQTVRVLAWTTYRLLYEKDVVCVSRPPPLVHTTHGKICHTSGSMTTKVPWRGLKSSNAPHSLASTHVWRSASFTYKTTFTGARRSTDL